MTQDEAKDFLTQAIIAFPGIGQWIQDNSPEPPKTIETWAKALQCISASEALSVLSRWINGDLPVPVGYQKESFHLHVKQVVMQDRSKRYAAKEREEQFRKQNGRGRSESYFPMLGPFMTKVYAVKEQRDRGQISESEMESLISELVAEAHLEIDRKARTAA